MFGRKRETAPQPTTPQPAQSTGIDQEAMDDEPPFTWEPGDRDE